MGSDASNGRPKLIILKNIQLNCLIMNLFSLRQIAYDMMLSLKPSMYVYSLFGGIWLMICKTVNMCDLINSTYSQLFTFGTRLYIYTSSYITIH